jgi:hypothetical protein
MEVVASNVPFNSVQLEEGLTDPGQHSYTDAVERFVTDRSPAEHLYTHCTTQVFLVICSVKNRTYN